ncbi:hypothetical protein [Bacteroides ihuae]|uniref:hypothetical protein n=1 Tax=Bacteroides ihuae TaxID=1852362 RepID=UPI0008D8F4CE|nr:hypothetical protein [Bacteroides ihuae]
MEHLIKRTYNLTSTDKGEWVESISSWMKYLRKSSSPDCYVKITFHQAVSKRNISSFHIALLSCFMETIRKNGYLILLNIRNKELKKFIQGDISLAFYWKMEAGNQDLNEDSKLNLWNVTEGGFEEYEKNVHRYFTNKFPKIDFLQLTSNLDEFYFNVFDHSEADKIAFSHIHYDETRRMMHVAICDFGVGIANTMENAYSDIQDDKKALSESIKIGTTSKSNAHNAGLGLDNVISALSDGSMFRMVSNRAILFCAKGATGAKTKTYDLPFEFKGTLISLDLRL